ncbi:uncharacterized protein LOC117215633 [Bombus bifarius]|uniref:Uncharacterized protein LOC117215633 n=1 Tax=Bombus bifarius TaxID=103933 RepID=A0A6P8MVJ2_9HYME|nr:uncharacterized protein LOC117215633 [Bombus bifarius]
MMSTKEPYTIPFSLQDTRVNGHKLCEWLNESLSTSENLNYSNSYSLQEKNRELQFHWENKEREQMKRADFSNGGAVNKNQNALFNPQRTDILLSAKVNKINKIVIVCTGHGMYNPLLITKGDFYNVCDSNVYQLSPASSNRCVIYV